MPTFVLIGHCGGDSHLLKGAITRAVPDASITHADDEQTLTQHVQPDRILLVNRVLADGFDTESGIELIGRLSKHASAPRMLLISNFADAQQAAMEAGGSPGFGKREVNSPRVQALLREAAQVGQSAGS